MDNKLTAITSSFSLNYPHKITEYLPPIPFLDLNETTLSCGSKHDQLVNVQSVLKETSASIPLFFGLTSHQMQSLFSIQTLDLWEKIKDLSTKFDLTSDEISSMLLRLQESVEKDILTANLPLNWEQQKSLKYLEGKTLIVRSSSNEDGKVVNAGGNKSLGGVEAKEETLKVAVASVIKSYFSLQSFKNRSVSENPFDQLPLCSVLIMEQITEDLNDPIVSGVMMTSNPTWSAPHEEGITQIAASWGFSSGTSHKVVCDEWVLTDRCSYPTIRNKQYRLVTSSSDVPKKELNPSSLKEIPCLTKKQLKVLREISKLLEFYFKQPMNVEFVFKGGQIYIVQARSIQSSSLTDTTYFDLTAISLFSMSFQGEMIVTGQNQVITAETTQVLFSKNLEDAEKQFRPKFHRAVVVYTNESSTTHPAVNFASLHPPVPCFVMPYETWHQCRKIDKYETVQLCPQTATLITPATTTIPIRKGLLLHPACFPISLGKGIPYQGKSDHSSIQELKQLLRTVPEELKNRLVQINEKLEHLFSALLKRSSTTTSIEKIARKLKKASLIEIEEMKISAEKNQMMRLAFHAGRLRQIIEQSGTQIIGAHSISGLEIVTQIPDYIDDFIQKNKHSQLLCELALLGTNGFDEPIQNKWLDFLNKNKELLCLKQLFEDLKKLNSLGILTYWFSEHFSSSSIPLLTELLRHNEKAKETNTSLYEFGIIFGNLLESFNKITSTQELEECYKILQEKSDAFLEFCKENQLRSPLLIDLIDLWDLSAKVVRTSHLFEEKVESKLFKKRVDAFEKFALKASECHVLNYSLDELINRCIKSSGKDHYEFSVQHWLVPISYGALSSIKTTDQKLTVIHQNLLQAASYGNRNLLPSKLATAFKIFEENNTCETKRFSENGGIHLAIRREEVSIRINIPLNFHSTVVTLKQKKGENEIEFTTYIRGSDNYQGDNLKFFTVFSKLTGIPITDHQILGPDLKVVCLAKDEEQCILLSRAINEVNDITLTRRNDLLAMCFVFDQKNNNFKKTEEKIINFLWKEFRNSGIWINFLSRETLWKYLKNINQLPILMTRVIEEIEGKRALSDFSKEFIFYVLHDLPLEECKRLVWNDMIGLQKIRPHYIPEELNDELHSKILPYVIEEIEGKRPATKLIENFSKEVLKLLSLEECEKIVWNDLINTQRIEPRNIPDKLKVYLLIKLLKEMPEKFKALCKKDQNLGLYYDEIEIIKHVMSEIDFKFD